MRNMSVLVIIALLLIPVLFLNSCNKDIVTYRDITGNWKVISFDNYETSTKITKTSSNTWSNADNTINFVASDATTGTFTGNRTVNSFSGNYTIDQKGAIGIQ